MVGDRGLGHEPVPVHVAYAAVESNPAVRPAVEQTTHPMVDLAHVLEVDEVGDATAEHLIRVVAENPGHGRAAVRDDTVGGAQGDDVARCLYQRPEVLLTADERDGDPRVLPERHDMASQDRAGKPEGEGQ